MDNEKTLGKISTKLIRKLYDENRTISEINHAQRICGPIISFLSSRRCRQVTCGIGWLFARGQAA